MKVIGSLGTLIIKEQQPFLQSLVGGLFTTPTSGLIHFIKTILHGMNKISVSIANLEMRHNVKLILILACRKCNKA